MTENWSPGRVEASLNGLREEIRDPSRDLYTSAVALGGSAQRTTRRQRPALSWAAVIVLAIALAVLAIAPARQAVADWLGIGSTRVVVGSAPAPPVGTSLSDVLGAPVSRLSAESSVGFAVAEPSQLRADGPPTYHVVRINGALTAVLVYPPSDRIPAIDAGDVGVVLSQRKVEDGGLSFKTGSAGALRSTTVGGQAALWLAGPHLLDAGTLRLRAANVLLWVVDGVEFRLESSLGIDEAVAIAETIGL